MPDLDVSDILLDPDFAEQITVNRITNVTGTDGRVIANTTVFTPIAVVTQGDPKGVVRTDTSEIGNAKITVHTRAFRIIGPQPGLQPDVVVWGGDSYVCIKSYNWSHFGAGFTMAECELQQTVTTS